jgi:hypothetical protein
MVKTVGYNALEVGLNQPLCLSRWFKVEKVEKAA